MRHQQKNYYHKQAKTPDPHIKNQNHRDGFSGGRSEQSIDTSKLLLSPCKFWKLGKCDWGWNCRFLHSEVPQDDPRRPEYCGAPVDFTQFPRPVTASTPYMTVSSPGMGGYSSPGQIHLDDQSRVKPFRKPCVRIITHDPTLNSQIQICVDSLLCNCIDVLETDQNAYMDLNRAKEMFLQEQKSDYVLFIDTSSTYLIKPEHDAEPEQVTLSDVMVAISNDWNVKNNNYSLEQLELLSRSELESVILHLAPDLLENIDETMQTLQSETTDAIASTTTKTCKLQKDDFYELKGRLKSFFERLNLANSIVADMPVYASTYQLQGQLIYERGEKPGGLSSETQKVVSFMICSAMSQVHICLSHINKVLGEYKPSKTTFPHPLPTSPGMRPTPFCAPSVSSVCYVSEGRERSGPKIEYTRRLEPEVSVELPTEYSLSFRRGGYDTGYSPFDQMHH